MYVSFIPHLFFFFFSEYLYKIPSKHVGRTVFACNKKGKKKKRLSRGE